MFLNNENYYTQNLEQQEFYPELEGCFNLAPSIPAARQLVTHGHIRVNSKKIHSPAYACKTGDNIQSKLVSQVQQKTRAIRERARHLQPATDGGKIIGIARKQSLPFKINDLRVVEYYSR